jgi:putative nucleotidyltransferase with HDIG domain
MTSERRHVLRFPVYAGGVFGLGALVAGATFLRYPLVPSNSGGAMAVLAVLVAAVVMSELLTVLVPGSGAVSLSVSLFVAVAVYAGPSAAIVAGVASLVPLAFSRPRLSLWVLTFNVGEVVLTTAVPALFYVGVFGAPLFALHPTFVPGMVVPLALAATTGTLVNGGLVGLAVNVLYGESLRSVWKSTLSWMLPSTLALGFVGVAIAQIVQSSVGIAGFALFVVPLLVARQTYQQSVLLRQAYADTISSMVAALEAKDVYTKGHSLRVAEYAVLTAGSLGVPPATIERIEYAALLHDLGKVGVSHRVLDKESSLSAAEYDEVKRHPDIGAHILSDVPYLADIVPLIAAHHERLDGSGYGHGLAGDAIPFEARILAVADAYDAMTSVRPYRGAMPHEAAMAQLLQGCGTQFDGDVVAAFERAWNEKTSADAGLEGSGEVG